MSDFRSGFVTIIGAANVGKSTLINQLVGEKVAIVSPKPQTTRGNAIGVYNDEASQIVFTDTPGIHKIVNKVDNFMDKSIDRASKDVDVLLFVLTAKRPLVDQYNNLNDRYKNSKIPKVIVVNKIDDTSFESLYPQLARLSTECDVKDVLPISALKGKNCDVLIKILKSYLPLSTSELRYYPLDQYTDKSSRFICAEIIREKILLLYDEEIPHGIAVQINSFDEEDTIVRISADIVCERESHKIIIIGKSGDAIKQLATKSRLDMEKLLGKKVFLELFVKFKQNWRKEQSMCNLYGYDIKSLKD